jgi:exosortase
LREHPELRADPGSAWGFLFVVPALLVHALDAGIHTELLSAVSLVLALPGLSLLFLGKRRTRAIAFPLAFALFALPIPLGVTESIHLVLRRITVAAASGIIPIFGVTVFTEGTTVHLARGALQVADACSGFSTLYAAAAAAALAAYAASSVWRRTLVLVMAPLIAIASNIVRVLFLILLVEWRGEAPLHTFLHPLSGLMTFALALPLIFWLSGPVARRGA